jgi:hypothetical protein
MNTNNNIFVWNCRGAASTSFFSACKHYVSSYKPIMLVIVEIRCDPNKLKRTFQSLGYACLASSEGQGFSGGIVVVWKEDCMNVQVCSKKLQYMHLQVQFKNEDSWFFTPVYASPSEENRRLLWEDLISIANSMDYAWLVAGDFNDIVCAEEKKGGAAASMRKCHKFQDRINVCNLLDLGAMGHKFTWRGPIYHGGQRIYERLDRALGNESWRLKFPDGCVKVLARLDFSDHHPLLITPKNVPHPIAPRQFRFESAWLMDNTYKEMMEASWKIDQNVVSNLVNVRNELGKWKFQTFDQVLRMKKHLMARIDGVQRRMQSGNGSRGLWRLEIKLQNELRNILKKEELMWFQRSRAK